MGNNENFSKTQETNNTKTTQTKQKDNINLSLICIQLSRQADTFVTNQSVPYVLHVCCYMLYTCNTHVWGNMCIMRYVKQYSYKCVNGAYLITQVLHVYG